MASAEITLAHSCANAAHTGFSQKCTQLALNKDTSKLASGFVLLLLDAYERRHAVGLVETFSQHSRSRRSRSPGRAAAKEPS